MKLSFCTSSLMLCVGFAGLLSLTGCPETDPPAAEPTPGVDLGIPDMSVEDMASAPQDMTPSAAPLSIANITATPTSGKAPLPVELEVNSAGGKSPVRVAWTFGDNSPGADGAAVSHTYTSGGDFVARATVTDADGESVSASVSVQIEAPDVPVINELKASPAQGIAPLTTSFQATVSGSANPLLYSWDFKDGATSERPSPTHQFDQGGTYLVSLVVEDEVTGAKSAPATLEIKVASDDAPVAAASATPGQGIAPLIVSMRGMVVGGNEPYSFSWNFGDGSMPVQAQNPSHEYTTPGVYTALFSVTDADGDTDTAQVEVSVQSNAIPQVDITATPPSGIAPLSVLFDPGSMGGDLPLSFAWEFGDGTTSSQSDPSHVFQMPGTYTVSLKVTDSNGDEATDSAQVVVNSDDIPAVVLSATPTSGLAPLAVQFGASAMGGNGQLSYTWTFGDGSPSQAAQNVQHVYTSSGTFTATLIVQDADGDSSTDTLQISVLDNAVPAVTASASPDTGIVPFNVSFQATVSQGDAPFTYQWDFGDGSAPSTQQDPSHSYTMGGTYTATVTVTDANGDTASDSVGITAADNTQPVVTASSDVDTGTRPLVVNFSAAGQGGNGTLTYQWFFGDGSAPGAGAAVSHTYANQGIYTATVVVTDADGDTSQDSITINVLDQAPDLKVESFTVTPSGDDLVFEVVIRNAGVQDATSSFVVRFYEDLATAPDSSTPSSTSRSVFNTVPAGGTATVTATRFDRPIGNYSSWVLVDPLSANPDLNRSNNVGGPVSAQISGVVINEVFYDSQGADTATFVELYGLPGLDVSGWRLEEVDGASGSVDPFTLPASTIIPANGYLVVGDGSVANEDVDAGSWADLQNGPDNVVLKDASGVVVDAVGWGSFASATFAGEGNPSIDVGQGYAIGRDLESIDTEDNAQDFFAWRVPTPGEPNVLGLTNSADTCADAFTLSDGMAGRFLIESSIGGLANNYTALDTSASGCAASFGTLAGADQVFAFVVPAGKTANVTLDLDDRASVDIDAALTANPCSSLNMGLVGCNAIFTDTFTGLAAGTYYLVVFEDSSTYQSSASEPYRYEIEISLQ